MDGEVLFNGNQPGTVGRTSAPRSALPRNPNAQRPRRCWLDMAMPRRNSVGHRLRSVMPVRTSIAYCYPRGPGVSGDRRRMTWAAHADEYLVIEDRSDPCYLAIGKVSDGQIAGYVGTKFPLFIGREEVRTHAG